MKFGRFYYGTILKLFFFLLITLQTAAQKDPVFTQYMFNGQIHNPAYAGMWEKIGFTALVREQWAGINRAPLTEAISFHTPLNNESVGLGLNIINDTYGREKRLSILADYSYEIYLTPQRRLRFGIKFGFTNYKNPLTEYELYPDNEFDRAFAQDIDLRFLPNFGIGAFLYQDNYYVGLSIPKLVENDFKDNYQNYTTKAELRTLYVNGGYIFQFYTGNRIVLKPTAMVRATWHDRIQWDLAINVLLKEKLWLGIMNRSNNAACVTAQWMFSNNMRVGFAMDVTYNDIFPYQNGTYEFTIGYDVDFFGRSYMRAKYF